MNGRPLLLALLLALAAAPAAGQTTGSNGYYDVIVSDVGEYTSQTGPLHPNPGLNVFYGGFIPLLGTTWNSVRSYGSSSEWVLRTNARTPATGFTCETMNAVAGPPLIQAILDGGGATIGVRHRWTIDTPDDKLTVTQEIVAEGSTYATSVVRVTLCVRNDDTVTDARIGVRYLWDWQIAGVDGPFIGLRPPDPPAEPFLSRETDFRNPTFQSYDVSNTQEPSVNPPFYRVGGTVTGPPQSMGPTPPELVQYVSWFAARDTCFDYATTGAIVGATTGTDSAVTYAWGATPATAIVVGPGATWCASQYAFAFVEDPPTPCDVTLRVFGGVNCGFPSATLDASPSTSTGCAGTLEYRFTDPTGRVARDWSTDPFATADIAGPWTVDARCDADPTCASQEIVDAIFETPPALSSGSATDVLPCNVGLDVEWAAARWGDAAGGVYDLHRSETSCDDALLQPAILSDVPLDVVHDVTTAAGGSYFYVVVAESATPAQVCTPVGPRGGAITTLCLGPVTERADPTPPPHVCWPLRLTHSGDVVKLDWRLARPPAADEHVHVLKALMSAASGFVLTSAEPLLASTWSEADTSATLQFFDVRYANSCEIDSADDEPPGFDPPAGVPCP